MALPGGLPSWMYGIDSIQNRMGPADPAEGGIDFGTNKIGVPLEALNDGTIVGAGYFCHGGPYFMTDPTSHCGNPGYGVVTIRMDTPYGVQDVYAQHINIDKSIQLCSGNCPGQKVKKGQVIGTMGVAGQNLLEMGVNVPWGGIWGTNHPGPWIDPEKILRGLITNYSGTQTTYGSGSGSTSSSSPSIPGVFDFASISPTLKSWGEYAAIFILALMFVAIGIYLLGGHPLQSVAAPINYVQNRRTALKAGA